VTLNGFEGHSPVAGFFTCDPSNICAAFYMISTDNVLAQSLCINRASYRTAARINLLFSKEILCAAKRCALHTF